MCIRDRHDRSWTISISNISLLLRVTINNFMFLVDIFNEIIRVKFQSCSYYTAFTIRICITTPLKLHNKGPINVNVKRGRCPCPLSVLYGIVSPLFLMTAFSRSGIEDRTDKILKCWRRNWFLRFLETVTVLQCLQWLRLGVGINGCCHNPVS